MRAKLSISILVALAFLTGLNSFQVSAGSVDEMLESKALVQAYNPELLDFLLEEGRDALPPAQHEAALDQLVTALKQDVDITPEEQRAAASAAAAAGLAQLFGGSDGRDLGNVAQDATYQVWRGWVDSAFTLQRAGYVDESNAFFGKCIEIFPYSDLRGRCAIGLAAGNPSQAFDRLMALTEANNIETVNAALREVGRLVGSEGFPADLRTAAIQRITEFTKGMKKASYGKAACYGLVATGDPQVVPTLQKLSKGMMNTEFYSCSRRGLLLTFDDHSVVPLLEKQIKGGKFSTVEPHETLFAASLLMEAGVRSGFDFAENELTRQKKKGLAKLMKSKDDVDLRPSLVRALVRAGGPEAIRVLKSGFAAAENGSLLQTWIAVGLLELGDTSQIGLCKAALDNPEWAFTAVRIARALAAIGDDSGIPALARLYANAAKGVDPDPGSAVLAFLAGEGAQYRDQKLSREARLVRLRRQVAQALGDIDRTACVPHLVTILNDPEASVRSSSADALAGMTVPETVDGLARVVQTDFGSWEGRPRNPSIHAHAIRVAAQRFGESEGSAAVVSLGTSSSFPSVRFLSLCVTPETGGEKTAEAESEEP